MLGLFGRLLRHSAALKGWLRSKVSASHDSCNRRKHLIRPSGKPHLEVSVCEVGEFVEQFNFVEDPVLGNQGHL